MKYIKVYGTDESKEDGWKWSEIQKRISEIADPEKAKEILESIKNLCIPKVQKISGLNKHEGIIDCDGNFIVLRITKYTGTWFPVINAITEGNDILIDETEIRCDLIAKIKKLVC